MRKKLLSTLLALCMALALLPKTALAGWEWVIDDTTEKSDNDYALYPVTGGNLHFNMLGKGRTIAISGYDGDITELIIPSEIGGIPVTEIADDAFYDCSSLTSVTIPSSVSVIGSGAFSRCSSLTSVTIPSSVTKISYSVFQNCSSLTSVTIPNSITEFYGMTFDGCTSLTDVYYTGREEQWGQISIFEVGNAPLLNATIHFNSTGAGTSTPAVPTPQTAPTAGGFADVPAGQYYAESVVWAVDKGITNGTGNNQFSPGQQCTNAQILTFLWRAYGEPEPTISNPFTNSIPDAYVKAAVWAYEKGMVSGTAFDADNSCTRAMAVMYMWQAAGSPTAPAASFTDVSAGASYAPAVAWALEQKITTGTDEAKGTFSPDDVCNRGQIVTFLYRNLA